MSGLGPRQEASFGQAHVRLVASADDNVVEKRNAQEEASFDESFGEQEVFA